MIAQSDQVPNLWEALGTNRFDQHQQQIKVYPDQKPGREETCIWKYESDIFTATALLIFYVSTILQSDLVVSWSDYTVVVVEAHSHCQL